ncbi:flagellar biosynthetic protein FliO [Rheinheimera muenzenbergensis]|uniref:Flagellar protein n=1 Tax=Rheinheimera muenzenbergensis TaxID=1193628 RepID=A0ABU8C1W2_9GAMM
MRFIAIIIGCLFCLPASVVAQQTDQAKTEAVQQTPATEAELAVAGPATASAPVTVPSLLPAAASTAQTADTAPVKPLALQSPAERPATGVGLGKMALSLLIVVAIVIALGWAFKKLTLRLPGSRHIKIISTMPLGPKERLLVIEMQGKQRVLGVTAHNINLLFELENSLPEEKLASDFHTQLQSLLKK